MTSAVTETNAYGPAHELVRHMVALGVQKFDKAAYTAVAESITDTIPPSMAHALYGQSLLHDSARKTFARLARLRAHQLSPARNLASTIADSCEATISLVRAMCPTPNYIETTSTYGEVPNGLRPSVQASLLYGRAAKVLHDLDQIRSMVGGMREASLLVGHTGHDPVLDSSNPDPNLPFMKIPADVLNEAITAVQLSVGGLVTEMSVLPDEEGMYVAGAADGVHARTKLGRNLESCAMRCLGCLAYLAAPLAEDRVRLEDIVDTRNAHTIQAFSNLTKEHYRSSNPLRPNPITTLRLCGEKLLCLCAEFMAYVAALLLVGDHAVRELRTQPSLGGDDDMEMVYEEALVINGVSLPNIALLREDAQRKPVVTTVSMAVDWLMPFRAHVQLVVQEMQSRNELDAVLVRVAERVGTNYNEGPHEAPPTVDLGVACGLLALLASDELLREEAGSPSNTQVPSEVLTYLGRADGVMPLHRGFGVHASWLPIVATVRLRLRLHLRK